MIEQEQQAASEGSVGQSGSTGWLERRVFDLWNQAVNEVGDCTYPHIILRFSELVAADEREACAMVCERMADKGGTTKLSRLMARECMAEIRMRSNEEVTGAPSGADRKGE